VVVTDDASLRLWACFCMLSETLMRRLPPRAKDMPTASCLEM
jgi:hypothetical protein